MRLLVVLLLIGCARAPVGEHEEPPPEADGALRIVSFNVWGVPFRAHHEALLTALGPALEALAPDVVCLQEVWFEDDAQRVIAALQELGLRYVVHRASAAFLAYESSGLVIASRHPLRDPHFDVFTSGRTPTLPWHADWFSGKGVLTATVDTPSGSLRVATTHLQAGYGTSRYREVRMAQVAELVSFSEPPDVIAGDFNAPQDALEMRIVQERWGLQVGLDGGIDSVLVAAGQPTVRGQVRSSPIADIEGERVSVSDHPLLFIDLVAAIPRTSPRVGELSPQLRKDLQRWSAEERARHPLVGWMCALLALASLVIARGRRWVALLSLPLALLAYRLLVLDEARDGAVAMVGRLLHL